MNTCMNKEDERAWKKRVETMLTELSLFTASAICSVDELRDEEIRMTKTTSFCLSEKSIHIHTNLYSARNRSPMRSECEFQRRLKSVDK